MKLILKALIYCATLAYPFLWYISGQTGTYKPVALLMLVVWLINAFIQQVKLQKIVSFSIVAFFALTLLARQTTAMYWYPVWINGLMLCIFAGSLFTPQSFIERLARLQEPNLNRNGVIYTRKLTVIWCLFFCFNITITLALIIWQEWYWWTIYTGIISYLLLAILFLADIGYRKLILKI